MTLDEALTLRQGDYVVHKATAIAFKPIRVTDVWQNSKKTIVQVRLASVDPTAWLDATGYNLPPVGKMWDEVHCDWVTKAQYRERRKTHVSGRRPAAPIPVPEEDAEGGN